MVCFQERAGGLPLRGGGEYVMGEGEAREFAALYPLVDIAGELLRMRGWLLAHPDRRKNEKRIAAFVNGWLDRAQKAAEKGDDAGLRPAPRQGASPPGPHLSDQKGTGPPNPQRDYRQRGYDNIDFEGFFADLSGG